MSNALNIVAICSRRGPCRITATNDRAMMDSMSIGLACFITKMSNFLRGWSKSFSYSKKRITVS